MVVENILQSFVNAKRSKKETQEIHNSLTYLILQHDTEVPLRLSISSLELFGSSDNFLMARSSDMPG